MRLDTIGAPRKFPKESRVLFTLEALDAAPGDCLILHYSDPDSPRLVVIDGGPAGVFDRLLRPRLKALHDEFAVRGELDVELVMVSHAGDDHIPGVLDWLIERRDSPTAMPVNILALWPDSSTALRDLAVALGLPINTPFAGTTVTLGGDLKLHVAANLPSLVVVAEFGGKTMLLTGDAPGDIVKDGLERSGFLTDGKAHFDLMKVPRHGCAAIGFFAGITADHYLISAGGTHGEIIERIAEGRGEAPYRVHRIDPVFGSMAGNGVRSVVVDLLTPISS